MAECHVMWTEKWPNVVMRRRYVKSYDAKQLRANDNNNPSDDSSCKPEQTLNGKPIVPCGLIAWSLFNDTYAFSTGAGDLAVNRKGISWKSDREDKFGKIKPQNFPNNQTDNTSLIGGMALPGDKSVSASPSSHSLLTN